MYSTGQYPYDVRTTVIVAILVTVFVVWASQFMPQPSSGRSAGAAGQPPVQQAVEETATAPDPQDVLWLARVVYSETKQPHEQELVAWVVRNRVETRYRGRSTYRSVALDPFQFSAFNADSPKRAYFMSLDETSSARGFQEALRIARDVMTANPGERPFSIKTRHFYSERSMENGEAPVWAVDVRPISLDRPVDPRRFRFFDQVA